MRTEQEIQEMEDRVAGLRQEVAAERVQVRELKQKVNEFKGRNRTLQQEISRLNEEVRKRDEDLRIARSIESNFNDMKTALEGVTAERYKEKNPFGHDCRWCVQCTTKVWQAANVAIGRKEGVKKS